MRTDHVFHVFVKIQGEETEVTDKVKEVVANVYDYFEELHRRQRTQGPLKETADATGVSRASIIC